MDIDGAIFAYAETRCAPPRLVMFDLSSRAPRRVFTFNGGRQCCETVRVAGRYVAWPKWSWVTVYDWIAGRLVYRAHWGRQLPEDFDLQRDGKLVISAGQELAWFSPKQPRPHVIHLAAKAGYGRVRISGDRIAFVGSDEESETEFLGLADLSGRVVKVSTFDRDHRLAGDEGDFDFDGRRLAWASTRITQHARSCPRPKPGQPPCTPQVGRGVTTIWMARLGAKPRELARMPFEQPPGP